MKNVATQWTRMMLVAGCIAALSGCSREGGSSRSRGSAASCSSNLKQFALATLMFGNDFGYRLPQAGSSTEFAKAIMPYLKDPSLLTCPETGKPYLWNTALSGKTSSSATGQVMLKDAVPHKDGKVYVAFPSGIVQGLPATDSRVTSGAFK